MSYDRTTRSRVAGVLVRVCTAADAGADPEGGPWVTICEEHAALLNHPTLADARAWAPSPWEWCEECRDLHERTDRLLAQLDGTVQDIEWALTDAERRLTRDPARRVE